MAEFTTLEIAAMCQRTERSVQRWLKTGRLPATHLQGNRYEVNESDLARFLPHEVVDDLVERMAALESRLERIEQVILNLGSVETKPARKRATMPTETPAPAEDIPTGSIHATVFAESHSVNRRTFLDHIDKGHVPAMKRPKPHREHETDRWLTPEQQQAAVNYWQEIGTAFETRQDIYPHLEYMP